MRRTTRAAVLSCAGVLALTVAGQALAAYSPTFAIKNGVGTTTIAYQQAPTDDPTAKLTFYVPSGYGMNLSATAGTKIGTVDAKATAVDLGGATLPLTGAVEVRATTGTYVSGGVQVPLAAAATICTGTASHSAYWVLVLTAAGQTLEVPLLVDLVPSVSPLAAVASATLTICLPPPDVPSGTPGRATFGASVVMASFTVKGVFYAPSAEYRWRLIATPYLPRVGRANAAGTVEAQSTVRIPEQVTARASGGTVTGQVTEGGDGVSGALVQILAGKQVLGQATTDASGNYTATVKPSAPTSVRARVTVADRTATCESTPIFAALGIRTCATATIGGFTRESKPVRIHP